MRKAIFWLHLAVGIVAGSVILSMAVSGVMIAWQRQITDLAERGFRGAARRGDRGSNPGDVAGQGGRGEAWAAFRRAHAALRSGGSGNGHLRA
ncbi:MAG: PepSY domain-containing protein [Chthoniobacter sp.]